MNPDARKRYLQHMEEVIEKFGWMVQGVFPTREDPDHLSFQYTIGLHDKGLPELLSFGLPMEAGTVLLNDVANHLLECKKTGATHLGRVDHERWPMPFYILDADTDEATEFATGAWFRSGEKATFVQVCWPDRQGRFPWEAGFEDEFVAVQPLIGKPS